MKKILVLIALLTVPMPALAQRINQLPPAQIPPSSYPHQEHAQGDAIAAVVNDNVITTTDLAQRARLAILSSGLPDTLEVRGHLLPQILRGLIDEQLQIQEAKRLDLSVSKEEIDQALSHIARDNHIDGDMRQFVEAHGASSEALVAQIRNGLLWNKVIQRELRPRVEVGEDEIDAVIDRVHADAGKQEFLVSEIFLAVDNNKDEEQVKQVADNLVRQIRGGANFSAVARQFSQSAGAAQGGDIGWIQQGQLGPELNRALQAGGPGEVSDPVRTTNGFHILGIREKRTVSLGDPNKASINLTQLFHAYSNKATKDAAMADAKKLSRTIKSCADIDTTLTSFPGWKAQKLGDMNISKAPSSMIDKVRGVPVGGTSEPLATDKGAVLLVVCGKNDGGDIDRDAIMHSIGTEKLELQARRLLRDLRRAAYLDVRLGRDS